MMEGAIFEFCTLHYKHRQESIAYMSGHHCHQTLSWITAVLLI